MSRWSFGVLLYELVTLGGQPYPGIETRTLVTEMRNGLIIEQPKTRNCPNDFYEVMKSCWQYNPKKRPTFSTLVKNCSKLLATWTSSDYVDLSMAELEVYESEIENEEKN